MFFVSIFSGPMRWSEAHDILLCREILMMRPYQFKSGSKESGSAWSSVSEDLNSIQELTFTTSQKSVRDRYRLLLDKHVKKIRRQEGESGSIEEETELDVLLQNIKDEAGVAQENYDKITQEKQEKLTAESQNAEEIRLKAMETLSDTNKRRASSSSSDFDDISPKRTKRNNGTDTMVYLKARAEQEYELRQQEIELKKVELDIQKNQQEQALSQQMLMQQQMVQQNQMMLALLEKFVSK